MEFVNFNINKKKYMKEGSFKCTKDKKSSFLRRKIDHIDT